MLSPFPGPLSDRLEEECDWGREARGAEGVAKDVGAVVRVVVVLVGVVVVEVEVDVGAEGS